MSGPIHAAGRFTPGKEPAAHWRGGEVGSEQVWVCEKRISSCREWNPSPSRSQVPTAPSGPLLWWLYDVFHLSFIVLLSFLSLSLYLSFSFSTRFIPLYISFAFHCMSFLFFLICCIFILSMHFIFSYLSLFYLLCLVYLVPFFVGWWFRDATTFVSTTPAWRNFAVFLLIILRVSFVCYVCCPMWTGCAAHVVRVRDVYLSRRH